MGNRQRYVSYITHAPGWAELGVNFICITLNNFSLLEIIIPFNYNSNHCHFPLWNEEAIFYLILKINIEMKTISLGN